MQKWSPNNDAPARREHTFRTGHRGFPLLSLAELGGASAGNDGGEAYAMTSYDKFCVVIIGALVFVPLSVLLWANPFAPQQTAKSLHATPAQRMAVSKPPMMLR